MTHRDAFFLFLLTRAHVGTNGDLSDMIRHATCDAEL